MIEPPLVSVVIPAFNAAGTLRETLESVSAQTYARLEIIVVDDGSLDDTGAIAGAFGKIDTRVRVIRQSNGGVASARNAGIRASAGEFTAFLDADDLWHPTKIAKQLALLVASGEQTALVYSPFRQIDVMGMVHGASRNHRVDGWVVHRHFFVNIIGNGSSILIRKRTLEALGGYATALLHQNAEGCEDLLLQLRVALRYKFATVPEYLVGYRRLACSMSSDDERMLRSGLLALTMVLQECPDMVGLARRGLLGRQLWRYMILTARRGDFKRGLGFVLPHLKRHGGQVVKAAWADAAGKLRALRRLGKKRTGNGISYRHFYEYDPADMNYADHAPWSREKERSDEIYRSLLALAPLDAAYRPEKYLGGGSETRPADIIPVLVTSPSSDTGRRSSKSCLSD